MEEALECSQLLIPLNSLITILSDFHFIANIRYNKISNFYNASKDKENDTDKDKIFDFFKKNLDEQRFNLFRKEKNFFHVENNSNSEFSSDHYYYTSNESISLIEINKKQKDFYTFFDNFFNSFKNKISLIIQNERFYYNKSNDTYNGLGEITSNNRGNNKNKDITDNFLKIISNNIIMNNKNNSNNYNNKTNSNKFFIFLECENNCDNDNKNNKIHNLHSNHKGISFSDFIKNQKPKQSCFDLISDKKAYSNDDNLKNILLVIKNEKDFKNFFMEFVIDIDRIQRESPRLNSNPSLIKTNEQKGFINLEFLRVIFLSC